MLDFVDDLVHRPPNQEQMRQLKELLLEEQKAISQLIALIDQHLDWFTSLIEVEVILQRCYEAVNRHASSFFKGANLKVIKSFKPKPTVC